MRGAAGGAGRDSGSGGTRLPTRPRTAPLCGSITSTSPLARATAQRRKAVRVASRQQPVVKRSLRRAAACWATACATDVPHCAALRRARRRAKHAPNGGCLLCAAAPQWRTRKQRLQALVVAVGEGHALHASRARAVAPARHQLHRRQRGRVRPRRLAAPHVTQLIRRDHAQHGAARGRHSAGNAPRSGKGTFWQNGHTRARSQRVSARAVARSPALAPPARRAPHSPHSPHKPMATLHVMPAGCRASAPRAAARSGVSPCGVAPRRAVAASGRASASAGSMGARSSALCAVRFGTAAFGAGGAALRAAVPQAAAGSSGARGGALVRGSRPVRVQNPTSRPPPKCHTLRCLPHARRVAATQATEMNLFERAVRVIKSYANAIVTSAEVRAAPAQPTRPKSASRAWLTRVPLAARSPSPLRRTRRRCWSRL